MKWIAFDQETASALAQHTGNVEVARTGMDEVESALEAASARPSALLMPAADGEHTLLATFRPREAQREDKPQKHVEPKGYEAGGFLGLADEPVYDDEQ